jgi:hypothetical protein
MSKSFGPKLAALLGAAAITAAATPAVALAPARAQVRQFQTEPQVEAPRQVEVGPSLRTIIEKRLASAESSSQYQEIEELTTLWMTLQRRDQLDRVVERGEQFLNVALRNQRRSELRSSTRRHRHAPFDVADFEIPAASFVADEALDAEEFLGSLEEPYRSAVLWALTGRNHREVADQMGVSHAAVRKWAQRLRDRLN